jgi:DNA adenine methylase
MKSFMAYVGGKSLLADRIIPKIPEHHAYIEVFAGAAWMLFKKEPSKVEIINDINSELITLYRCVQNHLDELVRCMRWTLASRDEWDRLREVKSETLTDIQRAVRFFFLVKNSFSSKLDFASFRVSPTQRPTMNLLRLEEQLSAAHLRLHGVYIENKPYQYIIDRYDRPEAFFYLDPPYYDCEDVYGKGIFTKADFQTLKQQLQGVKGRFIMSLNDRKEVREIYGKDFKIQKIATRYSLSASGNVSANELLISNF